MSVKKTPLLRKNSHTHFPLYKNNVFFCTNHALPGKSCLAEDQFRVEREASLCPSFLAAI